MRTHFLGFRQGAAVKAVPYLTAILERPMGDPRGGAMHVDGAYSWFRNSHPELRTWAAHYPLAVQRASRTDIHVRKWFNRIALFQGVIAMLRRVKNRLK